MPPGTRAILREVAYFGLFVALAIVMTWPLAIRLDTSVSDLGDPLLNTWILEWSSHALLTQPLRLFEPPVFHPAIYPLAYSEHLTGIAILTMPFHLAGLSPLTVYNIAMLLGFALCGYGSFVLARSFTASRAAAAVAGVFFAFVPLRFDHLAHLQVVWAGWIPLVLAALVAYWRQPTRRNAAFLAAAFVMNGLTNIYFLLFVSATLVVSLFFLATAAPRRDRAFWLRLLGSLTIAGVVLLPFLLPYRAVSDKYGFERSVDELKLMSPTWRCWLAASHRSAIWSSLTPEAWRIHEKQLFPGIVAPLLLIVGLWGVRRRQRRDALPAAPRLRFRRLDFLLALAAVLVIASWFQERIAIDVAGRQLFAVSGSDIPMMVLIAGLMLRLPLRAWIARSRITVEQWLAIVWLVVGAIGSLGLNAFLFSFFYFRTPVFASMRAPGRFAMVAYAGLAVWAAIGAAVLLRRKQRFAGPLLVAIVLIDLMPAIRWEQFVPATPPVYRWIAREQLDLSLELPIEGWWEAQYLQGSIVHRRLSFNGTSGFEPPFHHALRMAWEQDRHDELLARAERAGCRILLVHAHWTGAHPIRDALRSAIASGRLQYLRRFDHGNEGDFVFGFTRNEPRWRELREPDIPDGAGHFPAETLARFLRHETTHSGTVIGNIERPHWDEVVRGPLHVRGWAIAPNLTREVWVLLDEGRRRYPARRLPRPDVSRQYWWYYEGSAGFELDLPNRPFGVPRGTDVQVEVVDTNGHRTRLPDVLFYWDR